MEGSEFRGLLCRVGGEGFVDEEIPHRTALTKAIYRRYAIESEKMGKELQVSPNTYEQELYRRIFPRALLGEFRSHPTYGRIHHTNPSWLFQRIISLQEFRLTLHTHTLVSRPALLLSSMSLFLTPVLTLLGPSTLS